MQSFNIVLHSLYQLCLVFPNSASDVRAHKQGIESGKNTEHLVGVLGCSKLVTEVSSDAGLHTI